MGRYINLNNTFEHSESKQCLVYHLGLYTWIRNYKGCQFLKTRTRWYAQFLTLYIFIFGRATRCFQNTFSLMFLISINNLMK